LGCAARADYAPPGDLRDLLLIYCEEGAWTAADFAPYVAYSPLPVGGAPGARAQPRDWFYDSFLFMQYGGAPSGAAYIDGRTNQADWEAFRRAIFEPGRNLHALDRAVGEAAKVLGPPPRRIPIVVMIPYPHPGQATFGDGDGDGVSQNLGQPADCAEAIRWYIKTVIDQFAQARFAHLQLYGFYWMIEWVPTKDGEAVVRDVAAAVHERGLKFVWIPSYGAAEAERSAELGFDLSYLQPNYAFMPQAGREPDPQRLCETAERAAGHGLGIEIELDPATPKDPRFRRNLIDYLSHGAADRDGYMRSAPHAYYQGAYTIKELRDSPLPANRRLYDALYRFARGTYVAPGDRNLAAGRPCRFVTPPIEPRAAGAERCLTDGRLREVRSGEVGTVTWPGTAVIELDLGGLRPVGGVWAHYQLAQPGAPGPTWVVVSGSPSAEGDDWEGLLPVAPAQIEPSENGASFRTGAIAVRLARHEARRVRVEVRAEPGADLTLDEVEVLPATPSAWDVQCTVNPAPDEPGEGAGELLADGLFADPLHPERVAVWKRGPVEITLDLGLPGYVSGVALHLPQPTPPRSVTVKTADAQGRWREAAVLESSGRSVGEWLRVGFAPRDTRRISVRVEPGEGGFCTDEIEITTPANLALRRPYRVEPGWTSKYPDDGKKLTDGVRMTRDFGDGKAVGWSRADPTITLDLGAEHKVDAVGVGVEGGGYAWVCFPEEIAVLASTDGATWRPAGELKPRMAESGEQTLLDTLRVPLGGVSAQYVRVLVRRHGWAMIDEIEVLSGGRNVALGRPYMLAPPPDPAEPYADTTGGVLTDGEWGGLTWGGGRTVGWNAPKPAVELDLGRTVTPRKLRAYVLGGGPGAVWFPHKITVLASSDPAREPWAPVGLTSEHPAESGKEGIGAFMDVALSGRPCRYLRVEIEPHGWVMMGEVEVYGE
jgi:hypothetical protein